MTLLDTLNSQQLLAVTLPQESALILAGAGSGKTKVLTSRIAWLIQTGQVSPHGVLAVTFTNKAAKEMMSRISAVLPIHTRAMWVGTFHGLCHRMLRAHYRDANLPQAFQILDTQDQLSAIKRLLKSLSVDPEQFEPKKLMYFIQSAKEQGLRPSQVEAHDAHYTMLVRLYEAYEAQCLREGVVDFAELLLRSYELLQNQPSISAHYQSRFKYILVDEFQDTNALQYAWLKKLAGDQGSIFAVGDDDQSIYAFRGARVANMAQFESDFKVKNRIKLEQNYRSVGHILKAANSLIEHNKVRMGKNLWTDAGEGEPILVYEGHSDFEEAAFIVDRIAQLVQTQQRAYSELAILYRSNAQSRVLEQAFIQAAIPYRIYGGLRFFERAEIKHALAYLRLINQADEDTAFIRVVNFPARGIGARSVEILQDLAQQNNVSLYRAVPLMQGRAAINLMKFNELIESLRFESRAMGFAALVRQVITRSGLLEYYQSEREGEDRIENLYELVNAAAAFISSEQLDPNQCALTVDAETGLSILGAFLSHASLESGELAASAGQDAVQLMTIHAAKGLEFPCVFVTGLEEGLFPHENSLTQFNSTSVGHDSGLEEERRLMYVAITRAREQLFLTSAQQRMLHGQTRYHVRSRFLDELPESVLKYLTPRRNSVTGLDWQDLNQTAWGRSLSPPVGLINQQGSKHPYPIGTAVSHAKFGQGVVLKYEGQGSEARIQVNFGQQGMKWLILSMAKLQAA